MLACSSMALIGLLALPAVPAGAHVVLDQMANPVPLLRVVAAP
jgi:hypothetical protein